MKIVKTIKNKLLLITYQEWSNGYWVKHEYDEQGSLIQSINGKKYKNKEI